MKAAARYASWHAAQQCVGVLGQHQSLLVAPIAFLSHACVSACSPPLVQAHNQACMHQYHRNKKQNQTEARHWHVFLEFDLLDNQSGKVCFPYCFSIFPNLTALAWTRRAYVHAGRGSKKSWSAFIPIKPQQPPMNTCYVQKGNHQITIILLPRIIIVSARGRVGPVQAAST